MRKRNLIKIKKIVASSIVVMIFALALRMEILLNVISVNYSKTAAKRICSEVVNIAINEIMKNYTYNDLIDIVRSDNNSISSISANTVNINKIKAELVEKIQNEINTRNSIEIDIPVGTLTDIQVLSGVGPSIPLSTDISSAAFAEFSSEFSDSGINQTLHKIELNIEIEIYYITWSYKSSSTITNVVPIAETVIVGTVPESYRNFELEN